VFYALWRERFDADQWSETLGLNGREYLKVVLPKTLVSWALIDSDNVQIPVTAEAIEQHHIPDALLFAIERRALTSDLAGHVRAEIVGTAS
jgi:hypothetical protein